MGVKRNMVRSNRSREHPTFPKGRCGLPPRSADHAHATEPLPIMVRAFSAHSAVETARAQCTVKPDLFPADFHPFERCCRDLERKRAWLARGGQ